MKVEIRSLLSHQYLRYKHYAYLKVAICPFVNMASTISKNKKKRNKVKQKR